MIEIPLRDMEFSDLNPLLFGREECLSGKFFGPAIRNYTLIHYVERGMGIFVKGSRRYEVKAGEAFIILPGELTYYEADKDSPWTYRWIGFNGTISREFANLNPVISIEDKFFPSAPLSKKPVSGIEYILASQLFTLAGALFKDEQRTTNRHVKTVKDYVKSSYMNDIKVEKIADSLYLNRRYLSRIFKESEGVSIKEFILAVRMKEAKRLLISGKSVADAAILSGYSDQSNFSKTYKRFFGISPINERKK